MKREDVRKVEEMATVIRYLTDGGRNAEEIRQALRVIFDVLNDEIARLDAAELASANAAPSAAVAEATTAIVRLRCAQEGIDYDTLSQEKKDAMEALDRSTVELLLNDGRPMVVEECHVIEQSPEARKAAEDFARASRTSSGGGTAYEALL